MACYIDDILVSSADKVSHLHILEEVFSCLEKHGFKLKLEKCEFLMTHIEYLGHVSKEGIEITLAIGNSLMQYHWEHYFQHWTSAVSSCHRLRDKESCMTRCHSWQGLQVCARWVAKSSRR